MFDDQSVWCFFFFKQKTAYEMRISDWSSDVCSSDLLQTGGAESEEGSGASQKEQEKPARIPTRYLTIPPNMVNKPLTRANFYGMARPSRQLRGMMLVCLRGRSEPMTIVTLGIDLGKNLNSVVGLDAEERVVLRRRVRRATLAELADKLQPCTVAMEACCGAHHVGRLFASKGHDVRLMSPEYVRPYVDRKSTRLNSSH